MILIRCIDIVDSNWGSFLMVQVTLRKVTLAASLTALSVVLDILFKQFIPATVQNFIGLPYYAMPLIIGSMILGPIYGAMMAVTSDYFGTMASGVTYLPWFILSAVVWGVIPGLVLKYKDKAIKIGIVILVTHAFATLFNTYALYFYGWLRLNDLFFIRLTFIPINVSIMTFIIYQVNKRLVPVYEDLRIKMNR